MPDKTCSTCKWHEHFSWVCFNFRSEYAADSTDPEDSYSEWKDAHHEEPDL